ncbi:triose-phosphate isomerase [Candidatus Woesearchaeota archaeon]|nr:triose-phosphate isomerase [Candidatus Woesearchaeota archaeon]
MKALIAANWKMNKDIKEAVSFVKSFEKLIKNAKNIDIVICPPFTLFSELNQLLKNSKIKLGAQNMHFEDKGTFTGEISPLMLKDAGCEYVILGHSERRQYFNETDDLINKKVKSALRHNLKPILCIGETLQQRDNNKTREIIENQLINCLNDINENEIKNLVVAYEPVWAIGTGKNAAPEQAEEVHKFIRSLLLKIYNKKISDNARIIYGGSVKPENIKCLMKMKNINGTLVGGASLDPKSFAEICNAA